MDMPILRRRGGVLDSIFSVKHEMNIIVTILITATCGSFLQISGTSWDVTSHIMQEPETFFTPSHTVLYTGVGLLTLAAGLGVVLLFRNKQLRGKPLATPFKLLILGSAVCLVAGPSDFLWHERFGVDGLLSPPHLALITGMLINAVATVVGLARISGHISSIPKERLIRIAMVPAFAALWFTTTWYVYMFSLPFSDGENFQFNLNPSLAAIIAIIALPLLSSIIFLIAYKIIGRFGAATSVAVLVVGVNIFANIIPSQGLMISILPWYSISAILPALIADIILNNSVAKTKLGLRGSELIAGLLIGSTFYIFNYPMLTWAFAIPLGMSLANLQGMLAVASLTPSFLSTLSTVLAITFIPAALMGLSGAFLISRLIDGPFLQQKQKQQRQQKQQKQQKPPKYLLQENKKANKDTS
jgi:hypothetical protein